MKTFKVEIPEDQADFMLKLFEQLDIAYHEDFEPEERTYIAQDYMIEKGLIPKPKDSTMGTEETSSDLDKLKELRNAINRLQDTRSSVIGDNMIKFRLPSSKANVPKTLFNSLNDLKEYLQNYLRIDIDHISFSPVKGEKVQEDDIFEVIVHVKDANSGTTTITAGYSDKAL
ncbi:hypothetical protein [Carboxylicivirga linearis]|uniref:Uncharacterized protein n=1 Tax=Carboxylicivirga linearis TaxID=1628157 RepID=A0ABS5JV07_9BACT|nr:hypothetical protein [Carboxylicivirga linearis]MBS2098730.1 hypothetical protein [Carboxylicivirga linearis]